MLFGYDEQKEIFTKLADNGRLSHAYLLYGEPQIGKFLFARSLAYYLEQGVFDITEKPLTETLILDLSAAVLDETVPKESIGIHQVKEMQHFLYQTPQHSAYRIAIIRDGEWLTDQAQNALLKILEEPPHHSLILITATDSSVFMPAVSSRMQKVFFPILPKNRIVDIFNEYGIIAPGKGSDQSLGKALENSGRIGLIRTMQEPRPREEEAFQLAQKALRASSPQGKEALTDDVLAFADASPGNLSLFLEKLLINLREKPVLQSEALHALVELMSNIQLFSLSRRIHIKDLLYKIR